MVLRAPTATFLLVFTGCCLLCSSGKDFSALRLTSAYSMEVECAIIAVQFGVVPCSSWGSLPEHLRRHWNDNACTTAVRGTECWESPQSWPGASIAASCRSFKNALNISSCKQISDMEEHFRKVWTLLRCDDALVNECSVYHTGAQSRFAVVGNAYCPKADHAASIEWTGIDNENVEYQELLTHCASKCVRSGRCHMAATTTRGWSTKYLRFGCVQYTLAECTSPLMHPNWNLMTSFQTDNLLPQLTFYNLDALSPSLSRITGRLDGGVGTRERLLVQEAGLMVASSGATVRWCRETCIVYQGCRVWTFLPFDCDDADDASAAYSSSSRCKAGNGMCLISTNVSVSWNPSFGLGAVSGHTSGLELDRQEVPDTVWDDGLSSSARTTETMTMAIALPDSFTETVEFLTYLNNACDANTLRWSVDLQSVWLVGAGSKVGRLLTDLTTALTYCSGVHVEWVVTPVQVSQLIHRDCSLIASTIRLLWGARTEWSILVIPRKPFHRTPFVFSHADRTAALQSAVVTNRVVGMYSWGLNSSNNPSACTGKIVLKDAWVLRTSWLSWLLRHDYSASCQSAQGYSHFMASEFDAAGVASTLLPCT